MKYAVQTDTPLVGMQIKMRTSAEQSSVHWGRLQCAHQDPGKLPWTPQVTPNVGSCISFL